MASENSTLSTRTESTTNSVQIISEMQQHIIALKECNNTIKKSKIDKSDKYNRTHENLQQ